MPLGSALGGVSGFGRPNGPDGAGGRISGAIPAGGDGVTGCAAAGIARIRLATTRNESASRKCGSKTAPGVLGWRRLIRAQLIALATGIMITVAVGAEMRARQLALVQQKADPGARAEHTEPGFDLVLLGAVRF